MLLIPSTSAYNRPMADKPSALVDTWVIYCGDNWEQLKKLPPACIDLIYIDPPFNSNRNYELKSTNDQGKRPTQENHSQP